MSQPTNFGNQTLFSGSAAASFTSSGFFVGRTTGYSVQVTGVAVSGSISINSSADNGFVNNTSEIPLVTNWTPIIGSAQTISGSQTILYNISNVYYPWAQVSFSASLGSTGNVIINSNVKELVIR